MLRGLRPSRNLRWGIDLIVSREDKFVGALLLRNLAHRLILCHLFPLDLDISFLHGVFARHLHRPLLLHLVGAVLGGCLGGLGRLGHSHVEVAVAVERGLPFRLVHPQLIFWPLKVTKRNAAWQRLLWPEARGSEFVVAEVLERQCPFVGCLAQPLGTSAAFADLFDAGNCRGVGSTDRVPYRRQTVLRRSLLEVAGLDLVLERLDHGAFFDREVLLAGDMACFWILEVNCTAWEHQTL